MRRPTDQFPSDERIVNAAAATGTSAEETVSGPYNNPCELAAQQAQERDIWQAQSKAGMPMLNTAFDVFEIEIGS